MLGNQSAPTPTPAPLPDPLPSSPTFAQGSGRSLVNQVGTRNQGFGGTIMTSGQGDLTPASTARKSLLGQ